MKKDYIINILSYDKNTQKAVVHFDFITPEGEDLLEQVVHESIHQPRLLKITLNFKSKMKKSYEQLKAWFYILKNVLIHYNSYTPENSYVLDRKWKEELFECDYVSFGDIHDVPVVKSKALANKEEMIKALDTLIQRYSFIPAIEKIKKGEGL